MRQLNLLWLLLGLSLTSCIQDDIIDDLVPEALQFTNPIDTIAFGETYQLETRFTNNIGQTENPSLQWWSSDDNILTVTNTGLLTGVAKGSAQVFVALASNDLPDLIATLDIVVDEETTIVDVGQRSGAIQTTSSYVLTGDFTVVQDGMDLRIDFKENYEASRSLPGLYLYLTNNPNSVSGALEVGKVATFSGTHTYVIENLDIQEFDYLFYYCKPFRVKVGDGTIN